MLDFNIIDTPKDCDFLQLGEESGLVFLKQHAYPGKFRMKKQGGDINFELTEEALKHIAKESNRYIENGNKCNLPVEHTSDPEKNRGANTEWLIQPDSKGRTGLFSKVQFRDKEAATLAKTAQTSLFVPPAYEDGAKNTYVRPVRHVALTDYPVIPGLDGFTPIAASLIVTSSKKETVMPIKDLAKQIGLQLSDEILSDETKGFAAIAEAFKLSESGSKEELEAVQLELSEYKKLNPPTQDPVRVSKSQVNMLRENRELKLSTLVEKGNILSCVKKALEEVFCGEACLTLSLAEDVDDNFDKVIDALRDNDSIKLAEESGPQTTDPALLLSESHNPTIAAALKIKARAERAAG